MRSLSLSVIPLAVSVLTVSTLLAQSPRVFEAGALPKDSRLGDLRTLNDYFPFRVVESKEQWSARQAEIKRRILVSQGLWPEPTKSDLNAVVHRRIDHDDYTVEAAYFESIPGHFVTGSLYRPKGKVGPFPAVLCPHGHWQDARFYDAGESAAKKSIASGAERFESAARNHIQARCVQLARMGCVSFFYDMTGNCDSIQIGHRPSELTDRLDTPNDWGFFSAAAELRLQNMMGLQTWNSVRSIDFLTSLPDVDASRIGVTGASGGGTQSMIIAAIDERVTAAMPCVMVSTAMQGGCTCENAPLLRISQGNIDIAAAIAPRPLGLTAADDWTVELQSKGYPDLKKLYAMLGQKNRLTAVFHTHFKHNYNHVNRTVMYGFFNRHFDLGFEEPILEKDFRRLTKSELSVWDEHHPAPSGDAIGDAHEIALLKIATADSQERVESSLEDIEAFNEVVGGGWETIIGRRIDQVGDVQFKTTGETKVGPVIAVAGRLTHAAAGEQIPAIKLSSATASHKGTIVWITDNGKAGLFDRNGVSDLAGKVLRKGYVILSADLFGQGEFLESGDDPSKQRMWYQRKGTQGWERFSGYTYGYNHPIMVQRIHDALSLVAHAKDQSASKSVHLVGVGKVAGPIALAARGQSGASIDKTFVDLAGFQFDKLKLQDDPMFVPGATKYLGVDGLLSLCAPHDVSVVNIVNTSAAKRVYQSNSAAEKLQIDDVKLETVLQ